MRYNFINAHAYSGISMPSLGSNLLPPGGDGGYHGQDALGQQSAACLAG